MAADATRAELLAGGASRGGGRIVPVLPRWAASGAEYAMPPGASTLPTDTGEVTFSLGPGIEPHKYNPAAFRAALVRAALPASSNADTLTAWASLASALDALNLNPLVLPAYFATWRAGLETLMATYFRIYQAQGATLPGGYHAPGSDAGLTWVIGGAPQGPNEEGTCGEGRWQPPGQWIAVLMGARPGPGVMTVVEFGALLYLDDGGQFRHWGYPEMQLDLSWGVGKVLCAESNVGGGFFAAAPADMRRICNVYPSGQEWWQLCQNIVGALRARTPEELVIAAYREATARNLDTVAQWGLRADMPNLADQAAAQAAELRASATRDLAGQVAGLAESAATVAAMATGPAGGLVVGALGAGLTLLVATVGAATGSTQCTDAYGRVHPRSEWASIRHPATARPPGLGLPPVSPPVTPPGLTTGQKVVLGGVVLGGLLALARAAK